MAPDMREGQWLRAYGHLYLRLRNKQHVSISLTGQGKGCVVTYHMQTLSTVLAS